MFVDWFDPAFRAGGPIRSCVNFVSHLHDDYELFIYTGDTDLGESQPLRGVEKNKWTEYKNWAQVYYSSAQERSIGKIYRIIKEVSADYIYLNSMYSLKFSLFPLFLKRLNLVSSNMVLAPRGMLKASALSFKQRKKKTFLSILRWFGFANLVQFQATDEQECRDIKQFFPRANFQLAPNLPGAVENTSLPLSKEEGRVKILFVGRIHPIKNLLFLLEILPNLKGEVQLSIIGAKESEEYWTKCQDLINRLPANISVDYLGEMEHHLILKQLEEHHLFVLPTLGENFGHAIFEALSKGRPVLISDQTPWRHLESTNAGWDISLASPNLFEKALKTVISWKQNEFDQVSLASLNLARKFIAESSIKLSYHKLFS